MLWWTQRRGTQRGKTGEYLNRREHALVDIERKDG
jgi:hypothetical protein